MAADVVPRDLHRLSAAGYAAVDTLTGDDALRAPDVGVAVRVSEVLRAAAR